MSSTYSTVDYRDPHSWLQMLIGLAVARDGHPEAHRQCKEATTNYRHARAIYNTRRSDTIATGHQIERSNARLLRNQARDQLENIDHRQTELRRELHNARHLQISTSTRTGMWNFVGTVPGYENDYWTSWFPNTVRYYLSQITHLSIDVRPETYGDLENWLTTVEQVIRRPRHLTMAFSITMEELSQTVNSYDLAKVFRRLDSVTWIISPAVSFHGEDAITVATTLPALGSQRSRSNGAKRVIPHQRVVIPPFPSTMLTREHDTRRHAIAEWAAAFCYGNAAQSITFHLVTKEQNEQTRRDNLDTTSRTCANALWSLGAHGTPEEAQATMRYLPIFTDRYPDL